MVVVSLVLSHHGVPLTAHRRDVKTIHCGKVSGIEARAEHGALYRLLRGFFGRINGRGGLHGKLLGKWSRMKF